MGHAVIAALAFLPLLLVERGVISSDTKSYLYLDPARFVSQVTSMWYPTVALGTVTHQYVGYLFPMGPYYVLTAAIHLPTWIAQRLWLGAILFAAGAGILYLCKVLRVRGPGPSVAALSYMLSPYLLQYAARISVLLLPWAGLPWLVAFTVLALRATATQSARRASPHATGLATAAATRATGLATAAATPSPLPGTWKYPALFALVVLTVSGINASSVLYVIVAPCLWLVWAAAVDRSATWRDAGVVLAKMGVLSVLVSAWWLVGLIVEAGYGIDILRYTESVKATSSTSSTTEVLRGLGYWYFYGSGRLGAWTQSVVLYTKWLWLVALSFFLPALSFAAAMLVRWRHRGYFVLVTVLGVLMSVGVFPYADPTPLGRLLKAFMNDTTAGLAMRSTDRATPLVLLGLAMLLGAGLSALWARATWAGWATGVVLAGLVVANNPAVFNGDMVAVGGLTQPAHLPSYELAALHYLNHTARGTRVLAIPGNDFAAYTWGDTNDTPQPAVLTRPFVTREQQLMGSMATADTLYAIDSPIQTSIENPAALAPMARLLSAGNIMVEYDQNSAMYGVVQAVTLSRQLAATPKGLSAPRAFGAPGQRVAKPTTTAELLAGSLHVTKPPPVVTYGVPDPRPITRAESNRGALIVAGNASGLETLAAQGLLDTKSAIYYAGTLTAHPSQLRTLAGAHATLVVTDSNRKQEFRWNSLSANAGQIEKASARLTTSTTSSPVDLFPGTPKGSRTVATYVGAADVTASSYGNSVNFAPEDRPYSAIDGNLRTAWLTGTFTSDVDGQWWQAAFSHPVSEDHIALVQSLYGTRKRSITKVTLTFTGGRPVTARLGPASRRAAGQTIRFSPRSFKTLRITIDATSSRHGTPVGFAEVRIPGRRVVEVAQMPTDLLHALGTSSLADRLVIAMTRTRVSPYTTARIDPQMTLSRGFTLPTARTFALSGTATLSPFSSDAQIARLTGVAGATGGGIVASSSSRLTGDLSGTAYAAADGSSRTVWQSGFGAKDVDGAWLQYVLPSTLTVDHLTLQIVADRYHSVPAQLTVRAETPTGLHVTTRTVTLPLVRRSLVPGTVVTLPVHFPPVSGRVLRVAFTKVLNKRGTLANGTRTEVLPLGVATLGIPGISVPSAPAALPGTCQANLVRIDNRPVTVEVIGSSARALADGAVTLAPCGKDRRGIRLSAGHHVVETTLATTPAHIGTTCASSGGCAGWNVDELTLDSAPGGGPQPAPRGATTPTKTPAATRSLSPPTPGPAPSVVTSSSGATGESLSVRAATSPFELVLGESVNAGWHAVAQPLAGAPAGAHDVTLGPPELVDGFANGWAVTAGDLRTLGAARTHGRFTVTLAWTPQREVSIGFAVSALATLACVLLVFVPEDRWRAWRPRRRNRGRGRERIPRQARAHPLVGDAVPISTARHLDDEPAVSLPVGVAARRLSWTAIAAIALVTGAVAAAISQPVCGAGVAVAVAGGLTFRHLRILGAVAAVGLVAAAGALVVVGQALHPAPSGANWPSAYTGAADLAAMAVAFFGADAVVDYCRRGACRSRA